MEDTLTKKIQGVVSSSRGIQGISLSMLAIDTLSATLRSGQFSKQIFDFFILKGDADIRCCIAQNPHLSHEQWLKLIVDKNKKVSEFAKMNGAFAVDGKSNFLVKKE